MRHFECSALFVDSYVILLHPSSFFFFFKQKTAYEMRISDWSSDVCSSDLPQSRIFNTCSCATPPASRQARISSTPLVLSDTTRLSKPSRNSLDLGTASASGCDQRFAHSASPPATASRLRRNAAGAPPRPR